MGQVAFKPLYLELSGLFYWISNLFSQMNQADLSNQSDFMIYVENIHIQIINECGAVLLIVFDYIRICMHSIACLHGSDVMSIDCEVLISVIQYGYQRFHVQGHLKESWNLKSLLCFSDLMGHLHDQYLHSHLQLRINIPCALKITLL